MSQSSRFRPFAVDFDLAGGIMKQPDRHLVRRASDMRGHFADPPALERLIEAGDPVLYEVFEKAIPEERGHLQVCISLTRAGTVAGEYFMTKGHYHAVAGTAEVYLCLRGSGCMLMKTADGEGAWERFQPGRLVYVPPFWAHRTVNTGGEPLVSLCVYPGDAGHNYGDIEREGFPMRVFDRGGEAQIVPTPR